MCGVLHLMFAHIGYVYAIKKVIGKVCEIPNAEDEPKLADIMKESIEKCELKADAFRAVLELAPQIEEAIKNGKDRLERPQ